MSEGFSEHRCKKKYKSKRQNYPVVRVLLVCISLFLFIKFGFAEKLVNLLPLPALDGGKLVLLVLEAVRHKPVSRDKEALVNFVGFALLMILMVFVMYNDILKIVRK